MASDADFKRQKYGITLVPNASTLVSAPGDIDYDTNSGNFNFYTSGGPIQFASASGTQTFTNKTINVTQNSIVGTVGTAAQFDPSTGNLESSITTSTELSYVHGVTSSIQTQLNSKQSSITFSDSLVNNSGTITLVGDTASPSANQYYGTNGSSILGYYTLGTGSGTVTSVALTVPTFLSISGSPITTSGTLAVTLSGTALPVLNGGTGQTTVNSALNALLPSQTSQSGNFLTTDGTNTSWAATGGSSNPQIAYVSEQQASGTNGGGPSITGFYPRTLNTLTTANSPSWITANGTNNFTLTAGTYDIEASSPYMGVTHIQTQLYNTTSSSVAILGTSEYSPTTSSAEVQVRSFINGSIVLASTASFQLQYQVFNSQAGNGLGVAAGFGTEVYSMVKITKIA